MLICKDPPYLKVVADNRTSGYSRKESRNQLSKLMAARFQAQSDDGLLDGVRYVQTMLKGKGGDEPAGGAAAPAPAWPTRGGGGTIPGSTGAGAPTIGGGGMMLGGLVCVGLFVLLAVVVVLMVVSALFRSCSSRPGRLRPGRLTP